MNDIHDQWRTRASKKHSSPITFTHKIRNLTGYCIQFIGTIVCAMLIGSQASATVIFQDNFDRSANDDIGMAWQSNEKDANDVAIYRNQLRLRDKAPIGITGAFISIDAAAWASISYDFSWRVLSSTEASDQLIFGIADHERLPAVILFSTGLGDSGLYSASGTYFTSAPQNNLASPIQFGFWLDVNSASETLYLDDVTFQGIEARTSQPSIGNPGVTYVAEPASLALLVAGASLLAFGRRRPSPRSDAQ